MLIADLGRHDFILGRMWFEQHGVLIDCRNRRLVWPDESTLFEEVSSQLSTPVPRQILQRPQPNQSHQRDADRRDQRINRGTHRTREPSRTFEQDHQESLRKMQRALKGFPPPQTQKPLRKPPQEHRQLPTVEIALIGATGFQRHICQEGTETFITSLYEISRMIEEQQGLLDLVEAKEIQAKLPTEYHDFTDVFSKKQSDTLPPYRKGADHQIKLEGEVSLGYCPLYKQSAEELEAAKQYIMENLHKGFIEPRTALYASPILMARKPDGGLRFCVDYRKLNAITKKDRYPLPLIDEMLQRVSKARFFTKLDIRQGFHRIRIDPDSEDLTTFRTRYGSFKYKVMPFGVTNGPATFQRYINTTLADYLD